MDALLNHWFTHLLSGAAALSIVAHVVNTFPTPTNKYGAWLLGCIQYAVGQRVAANNTLQGLQTIASGVTTEQKERIENGGFKG